MGGPACIDTLVFLQAFSTCLQACFLQPLSLLLPSAVRMQSRVLFQCKDHSRCGMPDNKTGNRHNKMTTTAPATPCAPVMTAVSPSCYTRKRSSGWINSVQWYSPKRIPMPPRPGLNYSRVRPTLSAATHVHCRSSRRLPMPPLKVPNSWCRWTNNRRA